VTAPLVPHLEDQPPLPKAASAKEHLARLLDALLVLQVERRARVTDLARRVGLPPDRLRELLSSFMLAGADVVPPGQSSYNISFRSGDDGEVVALSGQRPRGLPLLDDVARTPMTVEEVARAVLTVRAVLVSEELAPHRREALTALGDRLEQALRATVEQPVDVVTDQLRRAVKRRRVVRFRYRDPWNGAVQHVTVEPYDLRRHRDRVYLDAGPEPSTGFRTYDVTGISDLAVDDDTGFDPPPLPSREVRERPTPVVLRVPAYSGAERRLLTAWRGRVQDRAGDDVLVRIEVDGFDVAARVGVLVLQLGPGASVAQPSSLVPAPAGVAARLLALHPA
jgi:predicted DNA-binding transcriptional regulator YafY